MCSLEHFTHAASTESISQIHSCGKNFVVTMSSGTSKAIRKTISAVSRARRPAKGREGVRALEKDVKGNREGIGRHTRCGWETSERLHLNHLITAGKHMAKSRFDGASGTRPPLNIMIENRQANILDMTESWVIKLKLVTANEIIFQNSPCLFNAAHKASLFEAWVWFVAANPKADLNPNWLLFLPKQWTRLSVIWYTS